MAKLSKSLSKQKTSIQPPSLQMFNWKMISTRVGIPVVVAWVIAIILPGWIPKVVVGVLCLAVLAILAWVIHYSRKSQKVQQILQNADSPEGKKAAMSRLETEFKSGDPSAVFAKAQLQMQENPKEALKTLEKIQLDKVLSPIADQARAQRGMIHLILGETDEARSLVDPIDLSNHKDPKLKSSLAAIVGEAWARTGQAKKAVELLETFDLQDSVFKEVKPQILRAKAFAYAWSNDTKQMKLTLKQMFSIQPELISGFITKKKHPMGVAARGVHPLLEKEAYDMVVRSGNVQRRVEFRR